MKRLHPWVRGEQNWHSVLKRKGADLSQNLGSWASLCWKWGWRYFSLFWEIHAPVAKEDGSARIETWVEGYIGQSVDSFVFELCFYITVQENDWTPFSRHCMRSFPSTTLYSAEECPCNIGALVSGSRMAELKARERATCQRAHHWPAQNRSLSRRQAFSAGSAVFDGTCKHASVSHVAQT